MPLCLLLNFTNQNFITMKKLAAFLFVSLSILVISCAGPGSENASPAADVQVTRKSLDSEVIKTVANLSIEGMTCAHGCGGKIQQELRAIDGVKTTDLDYADGREANTVSVEYDPTKISEQELIKCVSSIADGQYVVKTVEILDYKGLQSRSSASGAGVKSNELDKVFQIIDLVQSISRLVR